MRLLRWTFFLPAFGLAQNSLQLYDAAMQQISSLPEMHNNTIYDHTNLNKGIHIPQYNLETQDYETTMTPPEVPSLVSTEILPKLRAAADAGFSSAACVLGDIYTFGNFSVPTNYSKALEYYHASVLAEANGHAYFMLGLMYSTGMFGETIVDQQKASIYYEFAAKNGDINAILVLAYKYLNGIGSPPDCDVAQFYYSTAARIALKFIAESERDPDADRTSRNIYLADFNGGIYGSKISESDSSVMSKIDEFLSVRETIRENYIDASDSSVIDYYFDAVQNYHGGYFFAQNHTKAYVKALTCAYLIKEQSGDTHSLSDIDKYIYGKCQGLVGRMYLKGLGIERDFNRAHHWLQSAAQIFPDKENQLDLALLHSLDPTSNRDMSPQCLKYLTAAVGNDSVHALYLYAKRFIAPTNPFHTTYTGNTFKAIKSAAFKGHHEALFYLADAIESGAAASAGSSFTCAETVHFLKNFVERSEQILLPQLEYAFDQLTHGNYKNALLGYLIAAEQGLVNAQLSASFLLFQRQPIFTRNRKNFAEVRVKHALKYLELSSAQGHTDATILLGDLYSEGIPEANVLVDYATAFAYYGKAALAASAHGCYKVGYMYEYGLGSANNTVDYYMAKRYYDLSVKYYQDNIQRHPGGEPKANTYAVGIALLRLKLKTLFSKAEKFDTNEDSGWLSTLKKLAQAKKEEEAEDVGDAKAAAHYEGTSYEQEERFQMFDYVVLGVMVLFFVYVSYQNIIAWRRGVVNGGVGRAHLNVGNDRFQIEAAFAI